MERGTHATRPPGAPARPAAGGKVLLAEDERLVREVFGMLLAECGFEVLSAANGAEALALFRCHGPELALVMLDDALGDMTGWDALREMRALDPGVTALLCSGSPYSDQAQTLRANGWAGFLQKPFTPEMLRAKLAEILPADAGAGRSAPPPPVPAAPRE